MAKAAYLNIKYVPPGGSAEHSPVGRHVSYIGKESDAGVDLTHTQRDIEAAVGQELSSPEDLIKYLAQRPGVDAQGEAHGLWGKDGVADLDATIKEIEGLENAVHWRGSFSIERITANEIGVIDKEQWQKHTEASMQKTAEKIGIDYKDLEWRAAFHNDMSAQPHVHIVFWDKLDRPTERLGSYGDPGHIPIDLLSNIRAEWTKEFYGTYRNQIFEQKGQARDVSMLIARDLVSTTGNVTTVKSQDLTELVKDFEKLSKIMPGTGRSAYKYMPPFVKKQCDVVVNKLLEHPLMKSEVDAYVSNHVELSRHHGEDVGIHLRYNIKQTAKEFADRALLKGAVEGDVDIFISALQQAKVYEKTAHRLISEATGGDLSPQAVQARYIAVEDLRAPLVSLSGNSEWYGYRSRYDVADVDRQEGSLDRAAAWAREDLRTRLRSQVLTSAKECQGQLMVDEIARLTPIIKGASSLEHASEADLVLFARFLKVAEISEADIIQALIEASNDTVTYDQGKALVEKAALEEKSPNIKDWRGFKFRESILRHSHYVGDGKTLSKGSDIETYVRALKTAGVSKENIYKLVGEGFVGDGNVGQREAYLRGLASTEKVDFKEWQAFRTVDNVAHAHTQYAEDGLLTGADEEIRELYTHALVSTELSDEQITDAFQRAVGHDESATDTQARIQEVREQREPHISSSDWFKVKRAAGRTARAQARIVRHIALGGAAKLASSPLATQSYLTDAMRACGIEQSKAIELLSPLYSPTQQVALNSTVSNSYLSDQIADIDVFWDYMAARSVGDSAQRVASMQLLKDNPQALGQLISDSMHFAGYSHEEINEVLIAGGASPHLNFDVNSINYDDVWNNQAVFSIRASWKLPLKSGTLLGHDSDSIARYFDGLRAAGISKETFLVAVKEYGGGSDYSELNIDVLDASVPDMDEDIRAAWSEFREADMSVQALEGLQSDEFREAQALKGASEDERLAVAKVLIGAGESQEDVSALMQETSGKDEEIAATNARLEKAQEELRVEHAERVERERKMGRATEIKEKGAGFQDLKVAIKLSASAKLVLGQKADLAQGLEQGAFNSVPTMPKATQKYLIESLRAATFTQEEAVTKLAKIYVASQQEQLKAQVKGVFAAAEISKEAAKNFKTAYDVCTNRNAIEAKTLLSGATSQDKTTYIQAMKQAGFNERETLRSYAKASGAKASDEATKSFVTKAYSEGKFDHKDWSSLKANNSTRSSWTNALRTKSLTNHTASDQRAYIQSLKRAGITKAMFVKAAAHHGLEGSAESIYDNGANAKMTDSEITKGWYNFKTNNSIISTAPLMVEAQALNGASEQDREVYTRALLRTGMSEVDVSSTVHAASGGDENISKTIARTQVCAKMTEQLSSKQWHAFMDSKSEIFQGGQGMGAGAVVGQCMSLLKNLADSIGKKQDVAQPAMQLAKGKQKGAGKFKTADLDLERGIEHKKDAVVESGI